MGRYVEGQDRLQVKLLHGHGEDAIAEDDPARVVGASAAGVMAIAVFWSARPPSGAC